MAKLVIWLKIFDNLQNFCWAIVKFNLPTLGREEEKISDKKIPASSNFTDKIIEGLGGIENLQEVGNCAIRLRIFVKDSSKVDDKFLKSAKANGIFRNGNAIQIVIGINVEFVANEIKSRS